MRRESPSVVSILRKEGHQKNGKKGKPIEKVSHKKSLSKKEAFNPDQGVSGK